jgi:hypothetical protein
LVRKPPIEEEQVKSFTEELPGPQDRSFEIGGEVFRWHYPGWLAVAEIQDEDSAVLDALEKDPDSTLRSNVEAMRNLIGRIEVFLDPDGDNRDRWRALSGKDSNAIPHGQYILLYRWLLEVTSGRPTEAPSLSSPGSTAAEPTSKDG